MPCEDAEKWYKATGTPFDGVAPAIKTESSICSEIEKQLEDIENEPDFVGAMP